MSLNIFGNTQRKDIRVGYIHPDVGFVDNITIYDANKYAELNPGAQFIVTNRDKVEYYNINEVNQLQVSDVVPNSIPGRNCEGIQFNKNNPPKLQDINVQFLGGGGVGAQGNVVVGRDGSILAVDIIHHGYGYQYAPLVNFVDSTKKGLGATANSLIGEVIRTEIETFTDENEFEKLDFSLAPNFDNTDWGVRYGVNGEELGAWNPDDYINITRDPIRFEVLKYQDFLKRLPAPWWSSREFRPIEVASVTRYSRILHAVEHPYWGGDIIKPEKNTGLVEVEFDIYSQGTKRNRDLMFTFTEVDGDHTFKIKGLASGVSGRNKKVIKKVKANTTYKVESSARKKVKNFDRGIEQGLIRTSDGSSTNRDGINNQEKGLVNQKTGRVKKRSIGTVIFADYVSSANDNDDIQINCTRGRFIATNKSTVKDKNPKKKSGVSRRSTYDLEYRLNFRDSVKKEPRVVIDDTFMNTYAVSPQPPSDIPGTDRQGEQFTITWQEYFPYTGNYTFKGIADTYSTMRLSSPQKGEVLEMELEKIKGRVKNKKTPTKITKTIEEGIYNIILQLENEQDSIKEPRKRIGRTTETVIVDSEVNINYKKLHPRNRNLNVSSNRKVIKFVDGDGGDTNAKFEVRSGKVKFSSDGRKLVGQGQANLKLSWDDDPGNAGTAISGVEINGTTWSRSGRKGDVSRTISIGGTKETRKSNSQRNIFNTYEYRRKADRQLWKMNPIVKSNSTNFSFLNKSGVTPFDPGRVQAIEATRPSVKFVKENSKIFLKVDGTGRVKVNFKLDINDNPDSSGLALKEVRIDSDNGEVSIKRGRIGDNGTYLSGEWREKDTKFGSGEFTAGRKYRVTQIGGSGSSGYKKIDDTTIGFDDNLDNGYDRNAELEIDSVRLLKDNNSNKTQVSSDAYEGTHVIRWESIDFPEDGNYSIAMQADDSAKLFIGNSSGKGKKAIGNGLKDVLRGGDETISETNSVLESRRKNNYQDVTKFFKKGKYRIRVELTQLPGKSLTAGNPMGVAIDIKLRAIERGVLTDLSWNQNPFGIALTIDAPSPPVPREDPPAPRGRCPNNPLWTSRYNKGSSGDRWTPVFDRRWSPFMNRYAVSPIKPRANKGSATPNGVNNWEKSWTVDIPYDGFYGIKGTSDNRGHISIGGQRFRLDGFKKIEPDLRKVKLREGKQTIKIEVENETKDHFKIVDKKIFDTQDWIIDTKKLRTETVKEEVICHAGGGYGGLQSKEQKKVGRVIVGDRKLSGKGGRGSSDEQQGGGANGGGAGLRGGKTAKSGKGGTIDGGYGADFEGKQRGDEDEIRSDSNSGGQGAYGGGGGGGSRNGAVAGDGGNGGVKIIWGSTGRSVTYTKPGKYEIQVPQSEPGDLNFTMVRMYCIGGGGSGNSDRGKRKEVEEVIGTYTDRTILGDQRRKLIAKRKVVSGGGGSGGAYARDTVRLPAGATLEVVVGNGGQAPGKGSENGGDSYVKVRKFVYDPKFKTAKPVRKLKGVSYTGPTIASYTKASRETKMGKLITPFLSGGRLEKFELQGRTWEFEWENIEFEFDGNYKFKTICDDVVQVFIKRSKQRDSKYTKAIQTSSIGVVKTKKRRIKSGTYDIKVILENANIPGTNFNLNPVYVGLQIFAPEPKKIDDPRSWRQNPVGVSAMLIPPPCPQDTSGVGIVTDVVIVNPGVGYTPVVGPGYPVLLELDEIEVVNPGIEYKPTDPIVIIPGDFEPFDPLPSPGLIGGFDDPGTGDPSDGSSGPLVPAGGFFDDPPNTPGIFDPGDGDGGGTGTLPPPDRTSDGDGETYDPNQDGTPSTGGGGTGTLPDPTTSLITDPNDDSGRPVTPGSPDGVPGRGGLVGPGQFGGFRGIIRTGPFGRIIGVDIENPGRGFTSIPTVRIISDTGINAVLRPKFRVVRDPIGVDEQTLIQVTDLVGLKQTGYIDGRAYFGQTFIRDGALYAGVYETAGELVRVYDTLQESIDSEVTTPPSAILRQGTDIRSNDPRLNIPGTLQDIE